MPESIEQQLEQLQKNYLGKLALYHHSLEQFYQQLVGSAKKNEPIIINPLEPNQRISLTSLQQVVHKLSGSGGCFGFPEISISAEPLDAYLLAFINSNEQCHIESISEMVEPLFAAIQQALKQ